MKGNLKSILFDVITPDELIFTVKNLAEVFVSFFYFLFFSIERVCVEIFLVDLLVWKWQSRVPRQIWFSVRCNVSFTLELIFLCHMLI